MGERQHTLIDLNLSLVGAGLFDFQGMGSSCKLSLRLGVGEAVGGPLGLAGVPSVMHEMRSDEERDSI